MLEAVSARQKVPAHHVDISGPAGLTAHPAPTLEHARSITTDAFKGH